tara:strand:- start:980 stop:1513 length:534 start_codon:yes stop_codon:yes gene_type:complete
MFHRITVTPWARINESWNYHAQFDARPKESYRDPLVEGRSMIPTFDKSIYCEFYKNFAIDVVTETVYNYPYTRITEKTIRPIVHKRMFILVGPPGLLSSLQNKGFKTFSPFINEEYDTILDPHKRMECIVEELTRISKFSIDEIRRTMLQYKDILTHNHDHYHWLCHNEIEQIVNKL